MYALIYYVPVSDHERVKQSIFDSGAGKTDHYEQCCWQVKGSGQFKALQGSQPAIGEIDKLQELSEYKVEMICADNKIKAVIKTLLSVHPYEQPAYYCFKVQLYDDL